MTIEFRDGGPGSLSEWDQNHAEALSLLRRSRAYVLVTLQPGVCVPRFVASSRDLGVEAMCDMLLATADTAADSALELAEAAVEDEAA